MFFSKELLSRNDQLGILWLAGTMGKGNNAWRRLSKGRILESNIVQLSGQIVEPKRQLALRTTATLLLGIVVIYQRKFQYLVAEGNTMMSKFRTFELNMDIDERVDLPAGKVARFESITLPRVDSIQSEIFWRPGIDTDEADIAKRWEMIIADADARMTSRQMQTVPAFDSFEPICITISDEFTMFPQRYVDNHTARIDEITLRDVDDIKLIARNGQDDLFKGAIDLKDNDFNFDFNLDDGGFGDAFAGIDLMAFERDDIFVNDGQRDIFDGEIQTPEEDLIHSRTRERPTTRRRKRKQGDLILDTETELGNAEIRNLLNDPTPLLRTNGTVNAVSGNADVQFEGIDPVAALSNPSYLKFPESSLLARFWKEHCAIPKLKRRRLANEDDFGQPLFDGPDIGGFGEENMFADEYPEFSRAVHLEHQLPAISVGDSHIGAIMDDNSALLLTPDRREPSRSPQGRVSPMENNDARFDEGPISPEELPFYKGMEKRSWRMLKFLKNGIGEQEEEGLDVHHFSTLVRTKKRELAAKSFYQILVLTTNGYLRVDQNTPFGGIAINITHKATATEL